MRIVFIGSVVFSEKTLEKLIVLKANIVGVCTLEKSPFQADHIDLTKLCIKHNIKMRYATDINSDENISWIKTLAPDVIFCFGWSRLLKSKLLSLAPMGVVGFHPAALPANRGRHPLIWALILGLDETASTFFFMDEGADSGDILSQYSIKISENDNAGTLYKRITETALRQIDEFLPKLQSGDYKRIKQDHSKSNTWRKRGKNDGKIDWRMSAITIHNLVRGLTKPYIGAHIEYKDEIIKIWETKVIRVGEENIEPGKVILVDNNGIVVKAGENAIRLIKTDPVLDIGPGSYL